MRRFLLASFGVLLLVAALVAYERSRAAAPEARTALTPAAAADGAAAAASAPGADEAAPRAGAAGGTSRAATAGQAQLAAGGAESPLPASTAAQLAPGPHLLSTESAQSLREFAGMVAQHDSRVAAWLAEEDAQRRDAEWAEAVEAQLRTSVRLQGTRLRSLELGDPHCWTTVCIIYARGGASTGDAASDWQGLVVRVANEPWFPLAFADMNTMVGSDARGMKYVTFLIRKK